MLTETVWRFWSHRIESEFFIYKLGNHAREDTGLKRQSGSFWSHRIESQLFIHKLGDPQGRTQDKRDVWQFLNRV
jgi:hypothetical protein